MGSDPLCCEGFFPLSTVPRQQDPPPPRIAQRGERLPNNPNNNIDQIRPPFQQTLLISKMYLTIKSLWLALLLAPILLMGVKIPRNKGGHCPFRKSQLDSRMFGMAGPTGLWTHYHLGDDLNRLRSTKKKSTSWVYPTLIS